MKLGYLVSQYPAANHAFMLREISRLRALGFEISVASVKTPDRPAEKLTEEERAEARSTFYIKRAGFGGAIKAHSAVVLRRPAAYFSGLLFALRLGDWSPRKTISAFLYFVEAVIAGEWMRSRGAAHLHSHYASTVGLIVTRIFPITMSVTFHGPDEFENPAGFRVREKIEASRFVCAISNYARSQLMRSAAYEQWSKMEVTPLGVDLSVFAPRVFRPEPSPFRIACVARLAPVKGQHILLEAMQMLAARGRNVALHLAGGGPDRASLERDAAARGIADRVIFEGLMNQDQLLGLYRQTDALALPSFAEGLPVVLMEAMAMEIPCVTTWITGVPELIENGKDGLLIPPGDALALADAMERLIADSNLRLRIGQAGRPKVMELFDLKRNGAWLAEVFHRRLGS